MRSYQKILMIQLSVTIKCTNHFTLSLTSIRFVVDTIDYSTCLELTDRFYNMDVIIIMEDLFTKD